MQDIAFFGRNSITNKVKGAMNMIYMLAPQSKKRKKQTKVSRWTLYLTISTIIGLMLFAWIEEKSVAEQHVDTSVLTDFNQLWQWSNQVLEQGSENGEWSFRWDASLTKEGLDALSVQLFTNANGEPTPKNIRKNGTSIDGAGLLGGSYIQIHVTQPDQQKQAATILLQIEKNSSLQLTSIKSYLQKIHASVNEQDAQATIAMKVFGEAINEGNLKTVQQLALAQIVEQYEDNGTESSTLYTNLLRSFIWLNGEKMANLQMSEHRSTIDQKVTVTLGTPLISGEFGESVHNDANN